MNEFDMLRTSEQWLKSHNSCTTEPLLNEITEQCNAIYNTKNHQRGDSWKEVGLEGAAIELHAKWVRIRHVVLAEHGPRTPEDAIDLLDSLYDMLNYARMAAACLLMGKWHVTCNQADMERHQEMLHECHLLYLPDTKKGWVQSSEHN